MANTKDIIKHLEGKGEMDYDYVDDILFFKIKDRGYNRSLEFENMVIDIDNEDYIVGIQIFEASKFLRVEKSQLKLNKWQFKTLITPTSIEIRLFCEVMIRNKVRELNPIIVQQNTEGLPSQQIVSI